MGGVGEGGVGPSGVGCSRGLGIAGVGWGGTTVWHGELGWGGQGGMRCSGVLCSRVEQSMAGQGDVRPGMVGQGGMQ